MCRKLICLGTLLSLLIGIPYARGDISDELIGYWDFDEGTISGTAVADSSGKENHGISVGNPTPVPGKVGTGALALGVSKYIIIDSVANDIQGADDITLSGWVKTATTTKTYWIACNTATGGNVILFAIDATLGGVSYIYDGGTSLREIHSLNPVNDNQWHMLTYVKSGSVGTHYVDGVEQGTHIVSYAPFSSDDLWSIGQEWDSANTSDFFSDAGQLDEVAIWRRALTMAEIVKIYNAGKGMSLLRGPAASSPKPANESMDVPRDVTLSWEPGVYADKHDVYLGTNFNNVNDATGGVAQDANSYTPPQRLDFSTTYYWRVDEVNAPPTSHIEFKGELWQFTTEPIAYAIQNITATASGSEANKGPENTINGSGLDANDLHSMDTTDMWLSGSEPNAWIEYELDKVYKLHEMWVWNSNDGLEPVIGFGFKNVTIEHSVNGTDYTTLGTTHEFARAPGALDYAHNTTVDFGGATAKYIRLTANNNWGGILDQCGLSEVRFFTIPVYAKEPSPDSDTTDVAVDVTLGFRAGREADKHDVYLSTDEQAVIDGNAPVTTVTENSYGPLSLDLGKTYYWKINEVNEAEAATTWQGDLWNFTTHEFFVVDGFEDYNDYPPNEIWSTWVDGYGVSANGATVGYPNPDWNQDEHFAETTIVHGGSQAMPFFYSNTGGATYSEGERTFAVPQDWTKAGVQTLALYFHGTAGNTGQLYVKVNGSKVVYDGNAGNLARAGWQAWNIELASFDTSLQSVTTLAIGIDGNGASGTLYFDDIRLYARSRQFITPAEPDNAALVGHWKFDGDTLDYSGLGNDGTAGGDPTFVVGKVGSGAIDLDGTDDHVSIDGVADDITTNIFTLSAWIKTTQTGEGSLFGANDSGGGHELQFGVKGGNVWVDDGPETQFPPAVNDDQWHMVTYVRDEATSYIYVDGALRGTDPATDDPASETRWSIGQEWDPPNPSDEFEGMVDDVRFYNYALSLGEVAWLAGRTGPFDKPF